MLFRTMLFAPGNHPRKVEKVFGAGADAVILDLEDAVAITEKPATRPVVLAALQRRRDCRGYVRVNGMDTEYCFGDIMAVAYDGVDGIVLPMVETPDQLKTADWLLSQLERERGLAVGAIDLMPIVETGRGLKALGDLMATSTRVKRFAFGAGDFTLDMGMRWSLGEGELAAARAAFVLESRAASLEPPIDTVFVHLNEEAAFTHSAETARDTGFQGKMCIHPKQIAPAHAVFTPSADEIAYAEKVVSAFEAAEAEGSAAIQIDGYFVDYPIVEKARRTLNLARETNEIK